MTRTPKRPRDANQLAKAIVEIATGEAAVPTNTEVRARKTGAAGGPARATALTPEQRSEIARAARVCAAYHDEQVRGLTSNRVQVDEIWSFIYAKQKNVAAATAAPEGAGDVWTWTAIDADTKLIASYLVGGRGQRIRHVVYG